MKAPENVNQAVWNKMMKILGDDRLSELQELDEDGLRTVIAQAEKNVAEQEEAKRCDEALARAKEDVKFLGSAYNDAIKYQRATQRVASHLLQSQ